MTDHVSETRLQRAELAQRTGCNLETIRYYEKIGLMPNPPRSATGYRVYDKGHVSRLRFILRGRELGFSTDDIRGLLALVDAGNQTCAEVKARAEAHLAEVRTKIGDLQRIEKVLTATATACSDNSVPECPILEVLSSSR